MILPRPERRRPVDYSLLALTFVMLAFGLMMLFSASAIKADREGGNPYFYLERQAVFVGLGFLAMGLLSRIDYRRLRECIWWLWGTTLVLLGAALLCSPKAGVHRWIPLGPVNLQPSELAKITLVLFLADYLDRKRSKVSSFIQGTAVPWGIVGVTLLMIALGRDLGTPALLFLIAFLLLFVGGARPAHLAGTVACALPILAYELLRLPYRRERLLNFLTPFEDAQGAGYQLSQALLAVGSGGWLGEGLGGSKLKLLYLPAPHTDFIFPVICEELGMLGGLAVLGLVAAFLLRGVRAAQNAPDLYGTLLGSGLTFLICLQALLNIAMSIGLLPTKGLPLPFFSYGGSSILATMAAVGILLNISRHAETAKAR